MYESSGSGFVCFATLSYSDCLCLLYKSQSLRLAKPFPSIYTTTPNGTSYFVLCSFSSMFCFFVFLFSLAHNFHLLTLSSAIFFSQILPLSLSFFCRGNTSIVSVWMQCLMQSECFPLWIIIVFAFSICSLFIRSKNIYGFMIIVWIMIYICLWSLAQVYDGNDGCVFMYNKCFPT